MEHRRKARPVSGEIMTDGGSAAEISRASRAGRADIVEAEYETLSGLAGRDTCAPPDDSAKGDWAPRNGLDSLKQGRHAPRGRARTERGGPLFWTLGLVVVLAAFWVSGGHAVMRGVALTFPEGETPALRIEGVESRVEAGGDGPVLIVDGEAVNTGRSDRSLPDLSIAVRDGAGHTTHYFLGTSKPSLEGGESLTFSSRLIAPKDGVESVSVTFQEPER